MTAFRRRPRRRDRRSTDSRRGTTPAPQTNRLKQLQLFLRLRGTLDARSYFELPESQRKALDGPSGIGPITAWSFTAHPKVFEHLSKANGLKRYIVTIDTMRNFVYSPMCQFLQRQRTNISSFFAGGWTDFLCDIQMDEDTFKQFREDLESELTRARIERVATRRREAYSIFRVTETIVLGSRQIRGLEPRDEVLEEIAKDRARFEICLQDYRSKAALQLFGGQRDAIKRYLTHLKREHAIVSYKPVGDSSAFMGTDYVAMYLPTRRAAVLNQLLKHAEQDPKILRPVRELVAVEAVDANNDEERETTHIFINQYSSPGERNEWRRAVYAVEGEINLTNYPLEGTVKDTPISISDLPRVSLAARQYQEASGLKLGAIQHPLLTESQEVYLPADGLARHGVTLGLPGTGKTNGDLVLALAAWKRFQHVIVVDTSGGISSKLTVLPERPVHMTARRKSEIAHAIKEKALYLIEPEAAAARGVVVGLCNQIEKEEDWITGNRPRALRGMILIEEAGDLLEGQSNVSEKVMQFLQKASRKGWCLWLSLQKPTSLGPTQDKARLMLKELRNRLMFKTRDNVDVEMIQGVLREDGLPEADAEWAARLLPNLETGTAVCMGVDARNDKPLSPVSIKLPLLGV